MKKLLAVLMILTMVLSLVACGSSEEPETTAEEQNVVTEAAEENAETKAKPQSNGPVDVVKVKDDMLAKFEIADAIELNEDLLLNQYGITAEQVLAQGSFIVSTGLFPAEIVMVEAVDEAAAEQVAEKLNTRLDSLKAQSKSYDPESYEIAQACQVLTEGNYVAMFFSEDGAEMEELYNSYF